MRNWSCRRAVDEQSSRQMADWGTGPAATGQAEGGGQAGGGWRQAATRRAGVAACGVYVRAWQGAVYGTPDRTTARPHSGPATVVVAPGVVSLHSVRASVVSGRGHAVTGAPAPLSLCHRS
jgi:hypothetical protein